MGTKERQAREREEMRELILQTAKDIMTAESLESLSIRKIAHKIEYSPAIIYHYFKDKDDIINTIMNQGYEKFTEAIAAAPLMDKDPVQKLKDMTRNYINAALGMPDEFMAVQLNNSPEVLKFTSSMFPGASYKKPALSLLFQSLKEINQGHNVDDDDIELTAQVIAASTFGLILRLILEKDILSKEQKEKLINHYILLIVERLVAGNIPVKDFN